MTRVAENEWRVRHEVRQAWLAWSAALLRSQEIDRLIESMDGLTESTTRLAEVGELPRTEAALFVIERSQRRQERGRLEGEAAVAKHRLRMVLGLSPGAPLEFVPSIDVPESAAADRDVASSSLQLRRLREEYEVAEHALHREIRKQYPDLAIGPLYETDQGQSRIGFLGAIPIPVLNANRQGIAEATAERALARAAYETTVEHLQGSLAVARVRARMLRSEYEELVSVIGPMIDRQVADATTLVELGEGGGLVLLESLIRSHDTKLNMIDLRRDLALASAEVSFLLGPEWPTADSTPASDGATEGEVTR
jgi:outer membrane protein TolC